jgi:hypothetical protein
MADIAKYRARFDDKGSPDQTAPLQAQSGCNQKIIFEKYRRYREFKEWNDVISVQGAPLLQFG